MDEIFNLLSREANIPENDANVYLKKLFLLGYDTLDSIYQDVTRDELQEFMKPGHIKRLERKLKSVQESKQQGTFDRGFDLKIKVPTLPEEIVLDEIKLEKYSITPRGLEFITPEPFISKFDVKPLATREALIFIDRIGRGSSGVVYRYLFNPTLTLLAIKSVDLEKSSQRKTIISELNVLCSLSRHALKNTKEVVRDCDICSDTSCEYYQDDDEIMPLDTMNLDDSFKSHEQPDIHHSSAIESVQATNRENVNYATNFNSKTTYQKNESITIDMKLLQDASKYLIKFYDAYTDVDRGICLVMEYMQLGSLKDLLESGFIMDEYNLAVIAYSVLSALILLHYHNIVHRDIKLENILLTRNGKVRLADFGIVNELPTQENAAASTFTGTIAYMSPERLRGLPYKFESDIWALGVTLLKLSVIIHQKTKNDLSVFRKDSTFWQMLEYTRDESLLQASLKQTLEGYSEQYISFMISCFQCDPTQRPTAYDLRQHPFIHHHLSKYIQNPLQYNKQLRMRNIDVYTHNSTNISPYEMGRDYEQYMKSDYTHFTQSEDNLHKLHEIPYFHNYNTVYSEDANPTNTKQHLTRSPLLHDCTAQNSQNVEFSTTPVDYPTSTHDYISSTSESEPIQSNTINEDYDDIEDGLPYTNQTIFPSLPPNPCFSSPLSPPINTTNSNTNNTKTLGLKSPLPKSLSFTNDKYINTSLNTESSMNDLHRYKHNTLDECKEEPKDNDTSTKNENKLPHEYHINCHYHSGHSGNGTDDNKYTKESSLTYTDHAGIIKHIVQCLYLLHGNTPFMLPITDVWSKCNLGHFTKSMHYNHTQFMMDLEHEFNLHLSMKYQFPVIKLLDPIQPVTSTNNTTNTNNTTTASNTNYTSTIYPPSIAEKTAAYSHPEITTTATTTINAPPITTATTTAATATTTSPTSYHKMKKPPLPRPSPLLQTAKDRSLLSHNSSHNPILLFPPECNNMRDDTTINDMNTTTTTTTTTVTSSPPHDILSKEMVQSLFEKDRLSIPSYRPTCMHRIDEDFRPPMYPCIPSERLNMKLIKKNKGSKIPQYSYDTDLTPLVNPVLPEVRMYSNVQTNHIYENNQGYEYDDEFQSLGKPTSGMI